MTETPAGAPSTAAGDTLSLLVVRAFDEYCERVQNGEDLDTDAYCEQFPFKSMLRQLVDARSFLSGSLLDDDAPLDVVESARWPERGDTFGKYRLLLELGRGSFARVFLAAEPKLGDRLVAIKIGRPGSAEASILGPIQHPNIVPVLSLDEDEATGLTAVCMPYLGGTTLCHVLTHAARQPRDRAQLILDAVRDQGPPVQNPVHSVTPAILKHGTYVDGVRFLGAQLADALAYIHQRGILHLDLKPSNVLLTPDGVPMLLDFNLSTHAKAASARIGGTLSYMSPEHLDAAARNGTSAALDARADIFSLGVLLYELATGKLPFESGATVGPIPELCVQMRERQRAGPVPVCTVNPDVDRRFAELIESCLAYAPADRPASALSAARALRAGLAPQQRARRWLGRHPRIAAAIAFSLAAVGLLGFGAPLLRAPYSERQYTAGVAAYQQQNFTKAVTHLNEALSANQEFAAAYFARGRAHLRLDTPAFNGLAMLDFEQADKLASDGKAKACLGYGLDRQGIDGSFSYYEAAIKAGYATAEVYNNLGRSHLDLGGWEKAEQHLDRAIQLDGQLQAAFHNRARAARAKSLDHISRLRAAAAQLPGVRPVLPFDHQQKMSAEVSQWLAAGIADVEQAIKLGPGSAELYFDAGSFYAAAVPFDSRHTAPALRHLDAAIKKHHLDPERLTDVLLASLREEEAFIELKKHQRPAGLAPERTLRFVDPIKDR